VKKRYCHNCGAKIKWWWLACHNCGWFIQNEEK